MCRDVFASSYQKQKTDSMVVKFVIVDPHKKTFIYESELNQEKNYIREMLFFICDNASCGATVKML